MTLRNKENRSKGMAARNKLGKKQTKKKPSKQIRMFTFIYQFVWAMMPSYLVKRYSGSFYKGVFE